MSDFKKTETDARPRQSEEPETNDGLSLASRTLVVRCLPAISVETEGVLNRMGFPELFGDESSLSAHRKQHSSSCEPGGRSSDEDSSGSRSLASTPVPPPNHPETQGHLVNGAGGLFPSLSPSRESSLTVTSACASDAPADAPSTPSPRRGMNPYSLSFGEHAFITPTSISKTTSSRCLDRPVGPNDTVESPSKNAAGFFMREEPVTPSPTPNRKRATYSAPSTPPWLPKRVRIGSENGELESQLGDGDDDSENYSNWFSLSSARQLSNDLVQVQQLDNENDDEDDSQTGRTVCTPQLVWGNHDESVLVPLSHQGPLDPFSDGSLAEISDTVDDPFAGPATTSTAASQGGCVLKISYFSESKIEKLLNDLLQHYRAFYAPSKQSGGDEEPENTSGEEGLCDISNKSFNAQQARQTLKTVFANQLTAEDEEFLLEEEEEDALDFLMTWIRELKIPHTEETEKFANWEACIARLKELTFPSSAPGGGHASWPFIGQISLSSNDKLDWFPSDIPGVRGIDTPFRALDGTIVWVFDNIYYHVNESLMAQLSLTWDAFLSQVN